MGTWAQEAPRAGRARGRAARPGPQGQSSLVPGLAGIRRPSTRTACRIGVGEDPPRQADP
eukprot:5888869-Alexandrium_andersonii.AAC.1